MAKFFSKTKSAPKLGFRTPDFIRERAFGGKMMRNHPGGPPLGFTPQKFKIQHKG